MPGGERRTVTVAISLTETERVEALRRATAVGLRLAPYLRACAGLWRAVDCESDSDSRSVGPEEVERLALLREALRQLARAGSNCNQIAHAANAAALQGKPMGPVLAGTEAALADLRAALSELRTWPGLRLARRARASVPPERGTDPSPSVQRGTEA